MSFAIATDGEVPPSVQLYDRLCLAIASGVYPPGKRLPSIRQMAAYTGVHRNTVSKTYQLLKAHGYVETREGAGVYVCQRPGVAPDAQSQTVRESIERLLALGCPLTDIPNLVQTEVDRRLQSRAGVLVLYLQEDPGIGEILVRELAGVLNVAVQPLAIEALAGGPLPPKTLVTTRFLFPYAQKALGDRPGRLIPMDIYDYQTELKTVREMPPHSRLGLVSPSTGALRLAATVIHSERPDLLVSTVLPQDTYRLAQIARTAHTIIVGHGGEAELAAAVRATRSERTRPLHLLRCDRYVAPHALAQLKVELGLT